ncbi:DUF3298 and DUF4163 domain-containing protein [Taibaiella koreensis]|uniref:DUF3298 and DUF4163 domain-containing protein n=1 Tax=Taibaiella koreensis TaxID=1268548 RepID=UPI000E59F36E|nr:DUF3298 and DUF4163 domain-containing protein [Taibaiella koreensis]
MRKIPTLLSLALILLLSACGNNKKEDKQETATTAVATYDSVLAPNFYKRLEGTIAGQPVVMHLQCAGGVLQGVYYYLKHGTWLMVNGNLDGQRPNNLRLNEVSFSEGETTAIIDCQYGQGTLKGSWRSPGGDKNYLVELKETYPDGAYTFTAMSLSDSLAAFTPVDSSPVARISNTFVIPLKNDADGKWLEASIKKALHVDSSLLKLDIAEAMRNMNSRYLKSYHDEVKGMNREDISAMMNYEDMQYVSVCYNENGFVILNSDGYSYSGGAHGNGGSSFYCFDVRNRRELALKDVITADSAKLQPIVERAFRKQQGLRPGDSLNTILFENHLATTTNFYFTNKGLGFYYFPYEVAAYAVGPIHVFVDFTELKAYLKPDFAARLGIR